MADLMAAVKERRSIRRYESQPIPEAVLAEILEAVRWTPSWANTQCWDIVVVKETETKTALQEVITPKNPATKAIVAAPVVLALCARLNSPGYYKDKVSTKFGDWFMFDLGLATQTLCLVAQGLGLGTVIVGLFDHDRARSVLRVPESHEVVALIPMGYPAKSPSAPARKELAEFVHYEKF